MDTLTDRQKSALKGLKYLGYESGYYDGVGFDPNVFDTEKINAIREVIRSRFAHGKSRYGSYGLKHRLENQVELKGMPCQGYVSNGECIYAMILEGYVPMKRECKNAIFALSDKVMRCVPQYPKYDLDGNEYDGGEVYRKVYKVDYERYGHLLGKMDLLVEGSYIRNGRKLIRFGFDEI